MEEIRSKCWDETATTSLPCNGPITPSAVLGPDGEGRGVFDDVDDYNGLVNTPPQDSQGNPLASYALYTRSVTVCYVNSGVLDTCVAGPTPYKRVLVTVAWGGAGDQVQLVTVFSNH
jgi:MSHA pilin protein MshD